MQEHKGQGSLQALNCLHVGGCGFIMDFEVQYEDRQGYSSCTGGERVLEGSQPTRGLFATEGAAQCMH